LGFVVVNGSVITGVDKCGMFNDAVSSPIYNIVSNATIKKAYGGVEFILKLGCTGN
jgi:hypothetical protein